MGIPDHLTCLLRNLYAGQEATVRTGYGTTDWFQIGKGVCQGCILSPCLFNLHAEYITQNAGLDEAQSESEVAQSCPSLCDPWTKSPWDFPGKNTGVGCHFLLQGIFPTQGSNPGLPHCRQTLYHLSYQGSPKHKLESKLLGKKSITSGVQMTSPLCQKPKRNQRTS